MAKRNGCKFIVTYLCWCCNDRTKCSHYRPLTKTGYFEVQYDTCYYAHWDSVRGQLCTNPDAQKTAEAVAPAQVQAYGGILYGILKDSE